MPDLGFGFGEILLIAMLVLIVFGPHRLPEVTRMIGKGIREFRKGMNEIQRELEAAGRETKWQSPPTSPKPATGSQATIAGTATAAGAAAEAGSSAAAGETDGEEDPDEAPAPSLDDQEPPVPRDPVDPAREFIEPWSTDSSRPSFVPKASPEPVIAPPTTEPEPTEHPEPEPPEPSGEDDSAKD